MDTRLGGVVPGAPAGATSVVLNVTATSTTAGSFLTVYPAVTLSPTPLPLSMDRRRTR